MTWQMISMFNERLKSACNCESSSIKFDFENETTLFYSMKSF